MLLLPFLIFIAAFIIPLAIIVIIKIQIKIFRNKKKVKKMCDRIDFLIAEEKKRQLDRER